MEKQGKTEALRYPDRGSILRLFLAGCGHWFLYSIILSAAASLAEAPSDVVEVDAVDADDTADEVEVSVEAEDSGPRP